MCLVHMFARDLLGAELKVLAALQGQLQLGLAQLALQPEHHRRVAGNTHRYVVRRRVWG